MGRSVLALTPICVLVLFVTVFFAITPPVSHAQTLSGDILGGGNLILSTQPSFPEPHTQVTVSLDASSLNTLGMSISWFVDGVEILESSNERSVSFVVGELGTKHVVRVLLRSVSGMTTEATQTVFVSKVDVVIEADSYIPAFYAGRPLPVSQGTMRAVALLYGIKDSPGEYWYDWRIDNNPLFGGAVKGKRAATFVLPLFGSHTVSVKISDRSGTAVGRGVATIDPVRPELYFYEENALRGMSTRALDESFILVGDETVVVAESFFTLLPNDDSKVVFDWSLNGAPIAASGEQKNSITLRHTEGAGTANISCAYTARSIPPQQTRAGFSIYFE